MRGGHYTADSGNYGDCPYRFYLYADSDAIRTVHSFVYDGKSGEDFVSGIGI